MATTAPAADISRVRHRLRDEDVDNPLLGDDNIDEAIQAAVERYSQLKPDCSTVDITGNGTKFYNISNLTGFVDGWSYIEVIEYPAEAVSATHEPEFLDESSDWRWYEDASNKYLWLPNHTPASTETIRVTFTIPRVLSGSSDTLVSEHRDAVLALAASYCCEYLAAKHSSVSAPMVDASLGNWQQAEQRYIRVAKVFRAQFEERVGIGRDQQVQSAGVRHDWDVRGFRRGLRMRLTHWGRT